MILTFHISTIIPATRTGQSRENRWENKHYYCTKHFTTWLPASCNFIPSPRVSPGEFLPIEDNSVELIQVATALHWLDHEEFYRECDRVLVPGGVIAAFTYKFDFEVINHPNSNQLYLILSEVRYICVYDSKRI